MKYLGMMIGVVLFIWVVTSSCESQAEYHPDCPVCDESYASEEHLNSHCATNFEPDEEGYLCSEYYKEREALQIEAQKRMETLIGSHDFFLEGDDKITSSKLATKCLTCGIHFTHPSYGEHIKTCCP